jgi:alkanesulfonate monooxygenase SsuD/methylene tetrahydromethanopterin reductase-like flavin-dependent oxidoreductase (luciferase family)
MRIGAVLSPVAEWEAVADAARKADELGFDSVGLWDHYHSAKPEWAYVAGWSAHAALAQLTHHVRLLPMVLNTLHYELGVLAKESSTLALVSGGRFEMAVGAGDWPSSFEAWGRPFPPRSERIDRLREVVEALRDLWRGELVSFAGKFNKLVDAACTPVPPEPPRVVVGVGSSTALAESAVEYADELNIYADETILARCRDLIATTGRETTISMFFSWEWDKWPSDPTAELVRWRDLGIDRAFVSLGGADMRARLEELSPLLG